MICLPTSDRWQVLYHRAHALLASEIAGHGRAEFRPVRWTLRHEAAPAPHADDLERAWESDDHPRTKAATPPDFRLPSASATEWDKERRAGMFVGNKYKPRMVWFWAWKNLVQAACVSAVVYACYEWLGWELLSVPFLPIATIGTAVAFYVGFKNNSSYDRLWEGRRIWGSITNVSRAWAALVLSVVQQAKAEPDDGEAGDGEAEARRVAVYRQIAWTNALRIQLRQFPAPHRNTADELLHISWLKHADIGDELDRDAPIGGDELDEDAQMDAMLEYFASTHGSAASDPRPSNIAASLLRQQADQIARLKRAGWIDGWEHVELMRLITECYAQQGAAERIKSFPFPRQYANYSHAFVKIFIFLVPFGLMKEMAHLGTGASWLVIPFSTLVAWVFYSMEQVGDFSEDPFEGGVNDVPLSTICRNIEVDLREMLGETVLPPRLEPIDEVLM
jgi:ion channel-forming bestrophin family protein